MRFRNVAYNLFMFIVLWSRDVMQFILGGALNKFTHVLGPNDRMAKILNIGISF